MREIITHAASDPGQVAACTIVWKDGQGAPGSWFILAGLASKINVYTAFGGTSAEVLDTRATRHPLSDVLGFEPAGLDMAPAARMPDREIASGR
jgi:hypothetical protein